MKATRISMDYYEVCDSTDNWWTAAKMCSGNWYIVNSAGRQIVAQGRLGRHILRAVVEAGGVL